MALTGMLAEVTEPKVEGLLTNRRPEIFEWQGSVFEDRVRGAAVEVVLLTGPDPAVGPIRALAVEAVALKTASEIEYGEFPEQQTMGDVGRGYHLDQQYLRLLARLKEIIDALGGVPDDGGTTPIITTGRPRGRFPAPWPYPDPAMVRPVRDERVL